MGSPKGMSGDTLPDRNLSANILFDEVIRRDQNFGPLLQEIKLAYEAFLDDRGMPPPTAPIDIESSASAAEAAKKDESVAGEENAAEIALDAVRRPWMETSVDGGPIRGRAPAKVRKLQKENAALRELVRRFRAELSGSVTAMLPLDVAEEDEEDSSPMRAKAVKDVTAALSAWCSEEPLSASIGRIPPPRPAHVPGLDFSRLLELLEYGDDSEDEEEVDDDYDEEEVYEAQLQALIAQPGMIARETPQDDDSYSETTGQQASCDYSQ